MPLRDLSTFHDPDLILPIQGVEYRIKSPSILEADRIRGLNFDPEMVDDKLHAEVVKILGATRDAMTANGLPDTYATHAGRTALVYFGISPEAGHAYWQFQQLASVVDTDAVIAKHTESSAETDAPA